MRRRPIANGSFSGRRKGARIVRLDEHRRHSFESEFDRRLRLLNLATAIALLNSRLNGESSSPLDCYGL
jgi:hypothetical protein